MRNAIGNAKKKLCERIEERKCFGYTMPGAYEKRAYQDALRLVNGIEKKYKEIEEVISYNEEVQATYYVACFERNLTIRVKKGLKEIALKVMEDAYNAWHECPEAVGDECCEEYICSKLIQYGIIQGLNCCVFE